MNVYKLSGPFYSVIGAGKDTFSGTKTFAQTISWNSQLHHCKKTKTKNRMSCCIQGGADLALTAKIASVKVKCNL